MTIPAIITKIIRISLIAFLSALAVLPAQTGQVSALPNSQPVPADSNWHGGNSLNGVSEVASAVAVDGKRIYVGNKSISMWDGTAWQFIGEADLEIYAMAVDKKGILYVGGRFTQIGGVLEYNIARWDGKNWSSLDGGTDNSVLTLAVDEAGNVYAGGSFDTAGGIPANGVAMWDESGWHALGKGVTQSPPDKDNGIVRAITPDRSGGIYAGGYFSTAGDTAVNNIAHWDGKTWSKLGGGIARGYKDPYSGIYALAIDPRGSLYAGGKFVQAGLTLANNISKWDGKDWSALGGGLTNEWKIPVFYCPPGWDCGGPEIPEGYRAPVNSIVVDGDQVIAGGSFTTAGNRSVVSLARWDGLAWQNINAGEWTGINVANTDKFTSVLDLALIQPGEWVAVGNFVIAGGNSAHHVAVWNGTNWKALGKDDTVDGPVHALIPDQKGGVYMGGGFFGINGKFINRLAHWDGENWSAVEGWALNLSGTNRVKALVLDKKLELFAEDDFYYNGDSYAEHISERNWKTWRTLDNLNVELLTSMAVDGQGNVYVGGEFSELGQVEAKNIARWNGYGWEALGPGLDGPPTAMVVDDQDRLVVCGKFRQAGDLGVDGLARWNGKVWEWLNNDKIQRWPTSLLMDRGTLYLGGTQVWAYHDGVFTQVGDEAAKFKVGNVYAMAVDSRGRLIAGGDFAQVGDTVVNNIARWNGIAWEALGSGTDSKVTALAADGYGTIWVAGNFGRAGGQPANGFAHWTDPVYIKNWQKAKTR